MPFNLGPTGGVPIPGVAQPLQQPQHYDPAGIIMQAAALRQQKQLQEQQMSIESAKQMAESLQSAASLIQRKRQTDAENQIAQQQVDIARGRMPLEQAQTNLINMQAQNLAKGVGAPFYNTKQAAFMMAGPDATPEKVATIKANLDQMWPGGVVDKSYADQAATAYRFGETQATKQNEFNEKQWEELNNKGNPLFASSRQPLGQAVINNKKLNATIQMLQSPNLTDETLRGAVANLQSVFTGANKEEDSAKQQLYGNLVGKYNRFITNLTAVPQLAGQPQVVNQLLGVANELGSVNNQFINTNFDTLKQTYAPLIAKDPGRYLNWEANAKTPYMFTMAPPAQGVQSGGQPEQQSALGSGMRTIWSALGLPSGGQGAPQQGRQPPRPGMIPVRDKASGAPGWADPQDMASGQFSPL